MLTKIYQDEQYLVRWNTDIPTKKPPLSWHSIQELVRCLEHVQDYLEVREKYSSLSPQLQCTWLMIFRAQEVAAQTHASTRKRKTPDDGPEPVRRSSPFDRRLQQDSRTPSASRSSSVSSATPSTATTVIDVFNGVLDADEYSHLFCRNVSVTCHLLTVYH
jgi:histone-lysine N-methyltransferase SUV39H